MDMLNNNVLHLKAVCVSEQGRHIKLFTLLISCAIIIFLLSAIVTHGSSLKSYLVPDVHDTFMDYFNMLSNMYYGDPYYNHSNYPALCFIFWGIMFEALPTPIVPEYADGFYLRQNMAAMVGFIIVCILCVVTIYELIREKTDSEHLPHRRLLAIVLVFCGPMIFCIERGNILLIAFALTLFFCCFYNSNDTKLRYASYVALSIAAGLKIYPALFGLLAIRGHNFKELCGFVVVGVLFFTIPFFAYGGFNSISDFLSGYIESSDLGRGQGLGYNHSMDSLVNSFLAIIGKYNQYPSVIASAIGLLVGVVAYITSEELWKRVFSLAIICVWVPSFSYTYSLILFIIPLLFYLCDRQINQKYTYTVLFSIILSPLVTPNADFINNVIPYNLPLSVGTLLVNCVLFVMVFTIIKDNVVQRIHSV